MSCPSCGANLEGAFPGGTVRCVCGNDVALNVTSPSRVREGQGEGEPTTAYRTSAPHAIAEAKGFRCPFCGAPCVAGARTCTHCDVELASVRCPYCFALHVTGSRFCAKCGKELELEALLDPTDAPCPRCDKLLHAPPPSDDERLVFHECSACAGMFVSHRALEAILAKNRQGTFVVPPARAAKTEREHDIRYLKCPMCHQHMNRINFGKSSGIVVDVCKVHGTWFDADELTGAVLFVANGGEPKDHVDRKSHPSAPIDRTVAEAQVAVMQESFRENENMAHTAGNAGIVAGLAELLFEVLVGR